MLHAAATFGAGVLAGQGLGSCREQLPACGLGGDEDAGVAFKLSVHVHGAAAPGLRGPGLVARSRPRLEVALGPVRKETEVADFAPDAKLEEVHECPWAFGDTLTFSARLGGEADPGARVLRLRLLVRSDICLGRLQVQLPQVQEIGEGVVDLRRRVLPALQRRPGDGDGGRRAVWETPELWAPLTRVGETPDAGPQVAEVARVLLSFSVKADPAELLREAWRSERSLVERAVAPVVRCLEEPLPECRACGAAGDRGEGGGCGAGGRCEAENGFSDARVLTGGLIRKV